jgi:hypothetical protein
MKPSDETSGDLKPQPPITAEVNIRASGDLYRITRDTTSHLCDGEEVLVYDSVKVDVALPPRDEEGVPMVLESIIFRPEDEDFPLPHMPPEPPDIGQVERTTFTSRMQADIRLANSERPNVRISRSGVTVGDHHFSWETIHERGGLDQSGPSSAYFHGVGLSAEMEDLIFHFRPDRTSARQTIIRQLADEIDFIAAHARAEGFDGSPSGLVVAMHDDPEILMRAVLAMPWDHARRICGPAEVTQWIEENHPESPEKHIPQRQEPLTSKTVNSSDSPQQPPAPQASAPPQSANLNPEDSSEAQALAELEAMGYPKTDCDPGNGETFPVFPEEIFYNDEHPLAGTLPDNARPENWRELDSAFFNPSKAVSIRPTTPP